MKLQQRLKYAICDLGHIPRVARITHKPKVQTVLGKIRGVRTIYDTEWARLHPFDRLYRIETSVTKTDGDLPVVAHASSSYAHSYAGAQVGPLRAILRMLPSVETSTFVDLGCGKGRPLFVASEFPFRKIIGVELSPQLAEVARRNAEVIARDYPNRTRVRVEVEDAGNFDLPSEDVILFLYNPFTEPIIARVATTIERALSQEPSRNFHLIYCNPVCRSHFDALSRLTHVFTRAFPHEQQELGFGPGQADEVALWQEGNGTLAGELET